MGNLIKTVILNGIDNVVKIKATPGGLQDGSSPSMQVVHHSGIQWDRLKRIKTSVASLNTKDLADPIEVP